MLILTGLHIVLLICLIAMRLLLRRSVLSLWAISTLGFIALVSAAALIASGDLQIGQLAQILPERVYHDTYYVAFKPSFFLYFLIVFAVLWLIHILEWGYLRPFYPKATETFFWILHGALFFAFNTAILFTFSALPVDYQTYATRLARLESIAKIADVIAIVSVFNLVGLVLWSWSQGDYKDR